MTAERVIYTLSLMKDLDYEKTGVLHLFSETGTEGGYWALQDEKYITYEQSDWGLFAHRKVADPLDIARRGVVRVSRHRDGREASSLKPGDVVDLEIEWKDGVTDVRPSDDILAETWSYDGLVLLNTGDELTIYDKIEPEQVAWQGLVNLISHDELRVGPTLKHPFRLHHDQTGVDQNQWASWFLKGLPAKVYRPGGFIDKRAPRN